MDENYCLELALPNGPTVIFSARPNETMKEFGERIKETTGVSIDISQVTIDGKNYGEETSVINYFATSAAPDNATDLVEDGTGEVTEENNSAEMKPQLSLVFCCVPNCSSNSLKSGNVNFFCFPEHKKRCVEWILAMENFELLKERTEMLSQELAVCSNHFVLNDFEDEELTKLKATAVPSVFSHKSRVVLPENITPVATDEPLQDEINNSLQEEEEILVHPGSLCRLCAEPIGDFPTYLFENNGGILADKINACLPLSVTKEDVLPKQICSVCVQRLELQHSFAEACMEAEKKLTALTRHFVTTGLKKCNRSNKSKQTHCCPLCCSGGMQYLDTDGEPIPDLDAPQEHLPGLYSDDDDCGLDTDEDSNQLIENATAPLDMVYLPIDRNFSLTCELCEEVFENTTSCLLHCLTHASTYYFPCVICGLVLETDIVLSNHFQEHKTQLDGRKRTKVNTMSCVTCGMDAATRKEFIIHKCSKPKMKIEPDANSKICSLCPRVFTSSERAQQHLAEHSDQLETNTFSCMKCEFQCSHPPVLDHHVSVVHDNISHACGECGFQFITGEHLEKHNKLHVEVSYQYQCSFCQRQFSSLSLINQHMKTHLSEAEAKKDDNLTCPKCGETFAQRSQMQYHLETTHDSMGRMPSLIQYQCKLCSMLIKTSTDVLKHRTVHWKSTDPSMPFVCEYCGEAHASPNALARHRRYLHPDERPYMCTLCNHATRTLYEARVHRTTHTGSNAAKTVPIFHCEHCPELFTDKPSFVAHKRTHKPLKWYKCDICDKIFPERHRLAVHKRLHTGEKPYACGTCGKRFSQTSAMYTHALLHTGEKPHSCDICHRRFRIKSDRDNHRRKHTGEKPFKCQYCAKTFRTGQVFYQHRLIHTGERRFPCDICGRAFKRSHTLACHRRIHTGEKPNVCDVCGKGFRQRTDMRKHKMHIHNIPA